MKIVFCLDENYIKLATISIASYRKYNPKAKIIVVSERPLPESMGYDENFLIKLPKVFRNRGADDRITNAAYLKCFLTRLPYDKILYVDPDTICQKPLDELYNKPIKYIGLCESYAFGKQQARALGLPKYGITGMMVMNLEGLRKINFTQRCMEVEESYPTPSIGWQHDETCINVALWQYLEFLHVKYNYCHNRRYLRPIREQDAYILHYVGNGKADMLGESRYSEIQKIGEKIKGKKIAIVGNAESLFSKKNGKKIDAHDFIIRFNKGFIKDKKAQGSKTNLLLLACLLTKDEIASYNAEYVCNRSHSYINDTPFILRNIHRALMKAKIGSQPSTGFMAIDICIEFKAASIDLYGFDFEKTPTYYNPKGYKTQHNYSKEEQIIREYEKQGILTIN